MIFILITIILLKEHVRVFWMVRDNMLRTRDGCSYIVREYANGEIAFIFGKDSFVLLKKYNDDDLQKFVRMYCELDELMEIFKNPTVGDVTMPGFELLLQKTNKALDHYERLVPEEFREKLGFDKNKLEEIILSIQKEFFQD